MAFNLLLRSHRAYVLVGSLVLAFASLWPNVAVAQQLSPGCYQDIPSQPGFYVEPGKNYKVRIFQAPGDPVGQNPFWTSDYVNNVVQGLQAWSNANSASGLGVSYGTVSSGEDLRIQVWQGARQSIPGQDCQNGLCDSSIVRTSTGTTIYIQQDLSPFDFLKMVLHEVGHYQGLGDVYDPTANGRTVMADNVLISQRLAYVTACDQVKAAEYNREIWANIPPGGGQCPPGGCQDYGLPCGIGGGAPRDGWCYPPGGGGGVVTDWWWYFLLKSNDLPLSAVTSTGTIPATGAVTIATHDYDGRVVRVDWYANDGYIGTSTANPYSLPYANAAPGTYKLQANVWDQRLGTAWSAPVWVTVTPGGGGGGGGTVTLPNYLALWSHTTGQYVFAQGDLLVATNGQVQTLTAQSLGGGYYALRAPYNGYYVAAEGGGGGWVHVNRDTVREWETFRAVGLGGNVVAFQTYNGRYLNVDPATGIVFATATSTETSTRFSFTALP